MPFLFAWDYHGTLAKNNELAVQRTLITILREFGIPRRPNLIEVVEMYGQPWGDYFRFYAPGAGEEQIHQMVERSEVVGEMFAPKHVKPMDHAVEVLGEIKQRGDTNVVVSCTMPKSLDKYLKWIGVENLVDHAIGISDEHNKNGLDLPNYKAMKIREYAGSRFERIVVVGDREHDIQLEEATRYLFVPRNEECVRDDGVRVISDLRRVLEVYQ